MRYTLALAILACAFIACTRPAKAPNGITYKSAVQYNDYIIGRQTTLVQNIMDLLKVVETNLDSAEKMLYSYSDEAGTMITEIKGMPPYKGDSALRGAAIGLFSFYKRVFEKDYMQIIHIRKKGADMTSDDITELKDIVARVGKEEEGLDKVFHNAQKDFADKNNMQLTENKIQKKFDEETGK